MEIRIFAFKKIIVPFKMIVVRIFPFKKIVVEVISDSFCGKDDFEVSDSKVNKEKEYYFHVSTKTIFLLWNASFKRVVPHIWISLFKKIIVEVVLDSFCG